MANTEPTMDFLDGSDVDEDNVDQDVENVLLGSDDDEAHPSQPLSKSTGFGFTRKRSFMDDGNHLSEEEEDVLNLVLQGDEERLDFDSGPANDGGGKHVLPPVKVRNSVVNNVRESSQNEMKSLENEIDNAPSSSNNCEVNIVVTHNDENYSDRKFAEDDDYDDADDESETKNTRSRFTIERNVESFNNGGYGSCSASGSSSSVGIPIQTVGERKIRPGVPDGRPKHWNHNGPRLNGPRHPGRNHRFPHLPRPPPPMQCEAPRGRPNNMMNPPIVQFNDGIFTDFNQPLRHPHPRQPPPHGRFEPPRNQEQNNMHRPPMPPPNTANNMRPFGPQQNMRPFFQHPENQGPLPRGPGPANIPHPLHQQPMPPQRPDFNMRGQRPPRFPPNMHHGNQRPPHMNGPPMQQHERPPFHQRPHRPPFRHDFHAHEHMGMNPRIPNPQGYAAPPNAPPGFNPQQMQPNMNPSSRFMGPQGGPPSDHHNPFYMQPQGAPFHHQGAEPGPFQPDASWGGANDAMVPPPNNAHQSPWAHQQHPQSQQHFSYPPNPMYDQPPRPQNSLVMHPSMIAQHQLPMTLQTAQHIEITQIPTSIYIKPNSEIHEALSKGQFRPPVKDDSRHLESSSGSHTRHYDDRYHDRERSSSRRGTSPSSDRRRDDDYYDDRRSHHDYDRKSRRKYSNERRDRSRSPDKKISRPDRSTDNYERDREKEAENKHSVKQMEEAKKMGLGEDYVKKLEEQRKLRERILKTKEQRRKQVKVAGSEPEGVNDKGGFQTKESLKFARSSTLQKVSGEKVKEIEADSTVASGKGGKPKKILRIVRDKSGNIISKKVHMVVVAKPQQEGQQSTATA